MIEQQELIIKSIIKREYGWRFVAASRKDQSNAKQKVVVQHSVNKEPLSHKMKLSQNQANIRRGSGSISSYFNAITVILLW